MKEIKLRDFQRKPKEYLSELPIKLMLQGKAIMVVSQPERVEKGKFQELVEDVTELRQDVTEIKKYIETAKSRNF